MDMFDLSGNAGFSGFQTHLSSGLFTKLKYPDGR